MSFGSQGFSDRCCVTFTFDLMTFKPFQQCPLTWWIFETLH